MRSTEWSKCALVVVPIVLAAAGLSGCKSLSERYIALEVWKYERCFGHLPPGFTPPGAPAPVTAPPMRTCGQNAPCAARANPCCDPCAGASMGATIPMGTTLPSGGVPTPVTAGRPVVISDEVVLP
ncbi:MAG: hypothetical protein ABGW78_04235 [Pirellulales bacterium]